MKIGLSTAASRGMVLRVKIFAAAFLWPAVGLTCTPPQDVTPWPALREQHVRSHAIVFVGRFTSITEVTVDDTRWPGPRRRRAEFSVIEHLKGTPETLGFLETGLGGADCAPRIWKGRPFVIMTDDTGIISVAWPIDYPPKDPKDEVDLKALRELTKQDRPDDGAS